MIDQILEYLLYHRRPPVGAVSRLIDHCTYYITRATDRSEASEPRYWRLWILAGSASLSRYRKLGIRITLESIVSGTQWVGYSALETRKHGTFDPRRQAYVASDLRLDPIDHLTR